MKKSFDVQLRLGEIFTGVVWLALYLFAVQDLLARALALPGRPGDDLTLNKVYFVACFLITVLVFWRFLADSLRAAFREPGRLLKGLLLGFCVYEFCQVGLGMLIEAVAPGLSSPNDETVTALAGENFRAMAAAAILLAPVTEETLLRGLVFGCVREKSRLGAYLVTALLFAGMHLFPYIWSMDPGSIVWNAALYMLPSAALCMCYEYAGTIWAPILLHAILNGISMWALAAA